MASRQESAERTRALVADVRARIRRGDLPVGARIPGLTELGRRHGLSKPTVLAALQPLVVDGTLEVRTRVGMFVADARRPAGVHVIITTSGQTQAETVGSAFAAELEDLGAASLALEAGEFVERTAAGDLPAVLGVFLFGSSHGEQVLATLETTVPVVQYAGAEVRRLSPERVSYLDLDNQDTGARAARELLFAGRRDIAFLGMHADDHALYGWSALRAAGCAETIRRHHPRAPLITVTAPHRADGASRADLATSRAVRARVASLAADCRGEFTACVGADDQMVLALSHELRLRGVLEVDWPLMVGVEGLTTGAATHVSSVIPGWKTLGRRAGRLLFDSVTRRRTRTGEVEFVPPEGMAAMAAGRLTA